MRNTDRGYSPAKNFLPSLLRKSSLFHDQSYNNDSDFLVTPLSFVGKRIFYKF